MAANRPQPRATLLVLLGYFLLTLLFTWPLAANFTTHTTGYMVEDRDQNLWNLWWVGKSLLGFDNPYHSNYIYWPEGVSLYFHTLQPFNGLLAIPLLPIFGVVVTYNLLTVLSFVLTGYAVHLLAKYLLELVNQQPDDPQQSTIYPARGIAPRRNLQATIAFVAGAAFTFAPVHLSQMRGILQWVSLYWLPFYLYFLLRLLPPLPQRGEIVGAGLVRPHNRFSLFTFHFSRRYALLAAISLLMLALVDWYQVMYALLFTGLYLGYLLLAGWRWISWRAVLVRSAGVLLPVGVLLLPILLPMLRELQTASYMRPDPDEAYRYSADLVAFALPMRQHPLFGSFSFSVRDGWPLYAATNQYEVYLGFSVLLLASLSLLVKRARPFSWLLLVSTLLFGSLALGPTLQLAGVSYPTVPMPYALFSRLPFASISRSPDRFSVLVSLSLALLLAFGLWWLISKLNPIGVSVEDHDLISDYQKPLPGERLVRGMLVNDDADDNPVANKPKPLPGERLVRGMLVNDDARGSVPVNDPEAAEVELSPSPTSPAGRGFGWSSTGICAMVLLLLIFEFLPAPYPSNSAPTPPWYQQVAQEQGDFAIMELPRQAGYWGGGQRMRYQTAHGKRIFGGYISREYYHPFVYQTPGFAVLVGEPADIYGDDLSQQLAALNYYRARYIVLYAPTDPTTPKQVRDYDPAPYLERIAALGATPVYSDSWLQAWRVPEVARQPFVGIGEGWYAAEQTPAGPQRWFSETASLRLINPTGTAITATLSFSATALQERELVVSLAGTEVLRQSLPAALLPYRIPLRLPPGESVLHLTSPSGAAAPADDPRQLSFSLLNVRLAANP